MRRLPLLARVRRLGVVLSALPACSQGIWDAVAEYTFEQECSETSNASLAGETVGAALFGQEYGIFGGAGAQFSLGSFCRVEGFRDYEWGNAFSVCTWAQRTLAASGPTTEGMGLLSAGAWTDGAWEIRDVGRAGSSQCSRCNITAGVVTTSSPEPQDLLDSQGNLPIDRWTHICMTYGLADIRQPDEELYTLRLFRDGVLSAERTGSDAGALAKVSKPLYIGAADEALQPFTGFIDEVRVYDRRIRDWEVQWIYYGVYRVTGCGSYLCPSGATCSEACTAVDLIRCCEAILESTSVTTTVTTSTALSDPASSSASASASSSTTILLTNITDGMEEEALVLADSSDDLGVTILFVLIGGLFGSGLIVCLLVVLWLVRDGRFRPSTAPQEPAANKARSADMWAKPVNLQAYGGQAGKGSSYRVSSVSSLGDERGDLSVDPAPHWRPGSTSREASSNIVSPLLESGLPELAAGLPACEPFRDVRDLPMHQEQELRSAAAYVAVCKQPQVSPTHQSKLPKVQSANQLVARPGERQFIDSRIKQALPATAKQW